MKTIKSILIIMFFIIVVSGCQKHTAKVSALAEELGVDPQKLDSYGPGPFPLNYFLEQLNLSQSEGEAITRGEVQSVVLGFEVERECQYAGYSLNGDYSVVYLYYSMDFDSALKIVAIYQIKGSETLYSESDTLVELFYLDSPTQAELLEWQKCVEAQP